MIAGAMNAAAHVTALASGVIALLLAAPIVQDPATPPASRPRLPIGLQGLLPPREDLIQRSPATHPIEGVWELIRIVRARGDPSLGIRGYAVFTRMYMSLHLYHNVAGRPNPGIQSGFKTYRLMGNEIFSNALIGFRNDISGDIVLEAAGLEERRRFLLMGVSLRIYQDAENYLEFRRLE
jgi:hypothetical protein